jgi:hypothetical protein
MYLQNTDATRAFLNTQYIIQYLNFPIDEHQNEVMLIDLRWLEPRYCPFYARNHYIILFAHSDVTN